MQMLSLTTELNLVLISEAKVAKLTKTQLIKRNCSLTQDSARTWSSQ